MKMDWKQVANWAKIVFALEMLVLFVVLPDRAVWDVIMICLAQYAVFFPVDASVIIKNLKSST